MVEPKPEFVRGKGYDPAKNYSRTPSGIEFWCCDKANPCEEHKDAVERGD